jgi:hypothetical protein
MNPAIIQWFDVSAELAGFRRVRTKLDFNLLFVTLSEPVPFQSTIPYGREPTRLEN